MATDRLFQDMLNQYLAIDLLSTEYIKRDFLLTRCNKDTNWKGGDLIVPFKGGYASSIKFGGLTASDDIAYDTYVRGVVSGYKECVGTMYFNERDLSEHGGKMTEQSFLKNLLGTTEEFLDHMKQVVSVNMLNGSHFATLTSDATANDGLIVVDHPERFTLGMKVIVDDGNSTAETCYVSAIDMNTYTITLVTARGGATVVDFSANNMTVAQSAKCYHDGAQASSFTNLRSQLLSATNGGDATLFGKSKVAYPYLQALNFSGAAITNTNIIEQIFDHYVTTRKIGKGNPTEVVMSYKHLASAMKVIESQKGAYKMADGTKASIYGWTSIEIVGPKGKLTFTGVNEMDDDIIYIMDWKGMTFYTNNYFATHKDPNGNMYYTVRGANGYIYLVDIFLRGEFVVTMPAGSAVIHTISY